MPATTYHRPASIPEAARIAATEPEAKLLAGGQSMLPAMRLGLSMTSGFIDLSGVAELAGIRADAKALHVGAMTTHASVAASAEVRSRLPVLARLAAEIGDPQVRNCGTIGGSIANSDPAADYPAAVLALGATVRTNARTIAADAFFTGLFTTALKAGELITAVEFPYPDRAAYLKMRQPASRFALVGVCVAQFGKSVRVAVTGAGPCVFRATALEQALGARFAAESCASVRIDPAALNDDLHASAEYRAHLIGVLARRAVERALGSAS